MIKGNVGSRSGAPVAGVTITAERTSVSPLGGEDNKAYTAITGPNGQYTLSGLYYGS